MMIGAWKYNYVLALVERLTSLSNLDKSSFLLFISYIFPGLFDGAEFRKKKVNEAVHQTGNLPEKELPLNTSRNRQNKKEKYWLLDWTTLQSFRDSTQHKKFHNATIMTMIRCATPTVNAALTQFCLPDPLISFTSRWQTKEKKKGKAIFFSSFCFDRTNRK